MTGLPLPSGRVSALRVAALTTVLLLTPVAHAVNPTAGKALYQTHCASCHGDNGQPMMAGAPDFTRGDGLFQSDRSLFESIRSSKIIMHGFEGLVTEEEIYDIITYVRTLY